MTKKPGSSMAHSVISINLQIVCQTIGQIYSESDGKQTNDKRTEGNLFIFGGHNVHSQYLH